MSCPYLDRQAVGSLFGVGERRARQLMAGIEGVRIGNAHAVDRVALIRELEGTLLTERVQQAIRRRDRVAATLERSRRELAGRRVRLSPVPVALQRDLPEGVDLLAQTLCISFRSAEDLAAKLLALSQVMAEDWFGFAERIKRNLRE